MKLTRVTKDDDFEELLVGNLFVSGLRQSLAPQVLNLAEAVVVSGFGVHLSTACFVE